MSFSCPDCSFTTKYKCSLERHKETCKGDSYPKVYFCDVCGAYSTKNKTQFEKHQQSRNCKHKAEEYTSLREEIRQLKAEIKAINYAIKPLIYG